MLSNKVITVDHFWGYCFRVFDDASVYTRSESIYPVSFALSPLSLAVI